MLFVASFILSLDGFYLKRCGAVDVGKKFLLMSWEGSVGALPPLGFWDPLGLLKDADKVNYRNSYSFAFNIFSNQVSYLHDPYD